MTITLFLHKETLLRDLQTLQAIFSYSIEVTDKLRKHYEPLNISTSKFMHGCTAIQVSPEEFSLIAVFNGGI